MKTNIILGPKHGDIIHGLCAARAIVKARLGVCADIWLDPTPAHPLDGTREKWEAELPQMVSLVESQPFARKCFIGLPPQGTDGVVDLRNWRAFIKKDVHNAAAFFASVGLPFENEQIQTPWLFAKPSEKTKGMVVASRSERYQWGTPDYEKEIGQRPVVFVGSVQEFENFKAAYPKVNIVSAAWTSNFLELAELIEGCDEFIGGQGLAHSIAQALGKKRAYERNRGNWDTCWIGGPKEREVAQKEVAE